MVTWGFPLEKTLQEDVPEDSTKFLQPLGLRTAGARGQGLMRLDVSWEDGAFSNMGYDGVCSNLPQRIQERFKLSVLAVLVGVISNVLGFLSF
jgi:hypothetical protein